MTSLSRPSGRGVGSEHQLGVAAASSRMAPKCSRVVLDSTSVGLISASSMVKALMVDGWMPVADRPLGDVLARTLAIGSPPRAV